MNYNAFKQKCKEKGYSASSLVTELGISKSNITNWKNGGNPSYEILIKMAQTLECSVGYLLGTEDDNHGAGATFIRAQVLIMAMQHLVQLVRRSMALSMSRVILMSQSHLR